MNIENARFNMIEQQVKPWKVFDENLLGAMATTPRERFTPEQQGLAYADVHLPLGHNQNMLAPREIARMIQSLVLTKNDKVLEIGTGSGYSSALLAKLSKRVFSVDIVADFVKSAKKIHKQLALDNILVEEGDASEGWMTHAPYDAVIITAALPALGDKLKRNLAKNGRIVSIIEKDNGYAATLSHLDVKDNWQHDFLFPIDGTPMINSKKTNQFVF